MKAVRATHRSNLLAARNALVAAAAGAGINPSGAVELQHLIEDVDRLDAIFR